MEMVTTWDNWPEALREQRGLLNGERVKMVRELRGIARSALARTLAMPAKELARRERMWCFWSEEEQARLSTRTEFPIAYFVQDDPHLFSGPVFICGHHDDEEETRWCQVEHRTHDEEQK